MKFLPRIESCPPQYNFPEFSKPGQIHGVFSRQGGVSPAPFDSLNVSYHVGDEQANVAANRELIKKCLGLNCLVSARQVHGDQIHQVAALPDNDLEIEAVDALITDCPGVGLMIQQADCQAVMMHDPLRHAIGICHAGWRGSVVNIIGRTVAAMTEAFGSVPADLTSAISPALGPCCAEFVNYQTELPASFYPFQVRENHFDFVAISRAQLHEAGLKAENIIDSGICTRCQPDFFSYRRQKTTGRFCTVIGLKE